VETQKKGEFESPHLPSCSGLGIDGFSLAAIRDATTRMAADPATEQAIMAITGRWRRNPGDVAALREMQDVLETIRVLPRSEARLASMNTFVRTLGRADALATFLDMMRDSARRRGTEEEELSRISRNARKHSVYGWAGQTLLLFSKAEPAGGTIEPEAGVAEMLGAPPPPVWGLSMHIWQPNPHAKAFPSGGRIAPGTVVEPPHSHPFDFASMVSVGRMRQSIYAHRRLGETTRQEPGGRYDGVRLEHVDGVWPEHRYRSSCELTTIEAGVPLQAGESYYLSCDMIHDVEFDAEVARTTPAITLFLASEAVVQPHVYMASSMADAHAASPGLKEEGRALSHAAWEAKLESVAAYLRGEQLGLCLDDIVNYDGEYAFFHA
jgi:hypothetical protein